MKDNRYFSFFLSSFKNFYRLKGAKYRGLIAVCCESCAADGVYLLIVFFGLAVKLTVELFVSASSADICGLALGNCKTIDYLAFSRQGNADINILARGIVPLVSVYSEARSPKLKNVVSACGLFCRNKSRGKLLIG